MRGALYCTNRLTVRQFAYRRAALQGYTVASTMEQALALFPEIVLGTEFE